ncbi:MAG: methionyl-tRNA formyltransferase [Clostridia bacterium]|nr:methionyl-tRNA formyltransferase [Clostridia bacterium]
MKVIFMGTPDFAVDCLEMLINEGYEVPLVVSQPDRQRGRGHKVTYSPVKEYALSKNIPVFQPESLKNFELSEYLNEIKPDVIVVVAYGKILPEYILNYPKFGCINVHGSLLPKLRGAAPIQWSVINGDKETGVTTMLMDKGMDTGDILYKASIPIEENDTAGTLFDKLKVLGASLLKHTLQKIKNGSYVRIRQNEEEATYAPMIMKKDALIDFSKSPKEIINMLRGLNPAPVAYTYLDGKKIKIYEGFLGEETDDTDYGKIWGYIEDKGLGIVCGGGILYIKELHAENSRKMTVSEYMLGHKLEPGDRFTNS